MDGSHNRACHLCGKELHMNPDTNLPEHTDKCECCLIYDGEEFHKTIEPPAWICGVCLALLSPHDIRCVLRSNREEGLL